MSESIDRRVVEMRFDNKEFEQNANTTMQVLEKLKEKLSFKGTGEKFESASGLGNAIEGVKNRFSALEIIGTTALINLTNSAVNLGKQLAKSLTIDQVKAGFSEYELKMNSIQTIMASSHKDLATVNGYLNELNTYADKTIYSFSDMTSSIGKFTNAGVDLDVAVKAIQGISNEAALSGANANEASRAMYNFSQALSAGYVKLIDWKSIENANMATKDFKDELIKTAVECGTLEKSADGMYKVLTTGSGGRGFDEAISATKNFNDSLSAAWMTNEVLTKTLGRYADETTEIGKRAFAAAQDVKTFTQLLDTVKEAIGSGWAQTFEIIFGNLEEAKKLWTSVNNVVSGFVDKTSTARNTVLQTWKDLGGREDIAKGLKTAFGALSEAYRDAFPERSNLQALRFFDSLGKKLKGITEGFAESMKFFGRMKPYFTDIFKAVGDVGKALKDIFSGLFDAINGGGGESALVALVQDFVRFVAWISRGVSAVISFARAIGVFDAIHNVLLALNDIVFGISDSIYALLIGVSNATDVFSDFGSIAGDAGEKVRNMFSGLSEKKVSVITMLSSAVGKLFELLGKGLSHIDIGKLGGLLAGGGIMAAGMKLIKFIDTLGEKFEALFPSGEGGNGGIMAGVKETLGSLSDTLNQFQTSLKVGQLVAIAIAVGILAASCATLADIPAKKLGISVAAIGGLFTELGIASHIMTGASTKGIIAMSIAVVILAKAVKQMSEIQDMGKGLLGVGVILGELTAFCLIFDRLKIRPKALTKTGEGLILMAVAINLLAKPIRELGAMDTRSLVQGLLAMAAMLAGFTLTALAFSKIKTKGLVKAGFAMVIMAAAMNMLVRPISQLGGMNLESLAKGLGAMGVALVEIAGFTFIMGKIAASSGNIMKASAALLVMSIGIKIMAGAIQQMGADSGAGQGLSVLFGSLIILAGAMALMQNSIAGAAAMVIVAGALMLMAPAIALLSALDLGGVVVGLVALAGTLAIFGVGALLLAPVIPVMIALSAAMALLGVGVLSLGAGMTMLVAAFSMATGPIINGAESIANAFPVIAKGVGKGIITVIKVIGDSAVEIKNTFVKIVESIIDVIYEVGPRLVETGLYLIIELLQGIRDSIGMITEAAVDIILNFINGISSRMDDIVNAGFNLMISFCNAMADGISSNGPALANALLNVILAAIGVIVGFIPGFGQKGKEAIDNYRLGLQSGKGGVSSTASTISSSANTNLQIKNQYSNGRNATQGLINGLGSLMGTLRNKAASIANVVDGIIRKKNQIESPSKRLFKTGAYMMEGLIGGLDSLTGQYEKKAENVATIMIGSTSKTADAIAAEMNRSLSSGFDLSSVLDKSANVEFSLQGVVDRNTELSRMMERLSGSLDDVVDTMNSRSLNNYITVDGAADPSAFADDLIRSFRLNARTV